MISIHDVEAAAMRIAGAIYDSPCPQSVPLSEIAGSHIYCKLEYLQRTGSFKERGARNALLLLSSDQRRRGVIAASAGNHALGLAYHGQLLGVPVTVIMPSSAPLIKSTTCRRLGARVELYGRNLAEAKVRADDLTVTEGLTYIHGYDDPTIIAGQGTIGIDVVSQLPQMEAIIVPVGGGGLLAGVALAVKALKPDTRIIAVEPEVAASFSAALRAGKPVTVQLQATLADGLAVAETGANAFSIAGPLVDHVVTVSEDEIALAILRIVELEKGVVEGAGAATLAACMSGRVPEIAGKHVALLLTGGNIDPAILSRVIETGLVADGRLSRFTAVISDRPGSLADLAGVIGSAGASIKEVSHDRAFAGSDLSAVHVVCTVETRDRVHLAELHQALRDRGVKFF